MKSGRDLGIAPVIDIHVNSCEGRADKALFKFDLLRGTEPRANYSLAVEKVRKHFMKVITLSYFSLHLLRYLRYICLEI